MKKVILIFAVGLLFLIAACSYNTNGLDIAYETIIVADVNGTDESDETVEENTIMDAEFRERRIEEAILIPYDEIIGRAETELPEKNAVILIYCRSGRRSALAAADLVTLGFTNVYDFGGIIDWPYESISG